ncbi:hypothetical protein SASPL_121799 [Salvia splendens]|uniref:Uncharacterized protein n=1 Tax=Salvia splendens TaxID=180675 RepID=A0A8X8ZWF1_SALSN|nr:hypothetical protein SASPL_121799 [Salvia splendens]
MRSMEGSIMSTLNSLGVAMTEMDGADTWNLKFGYKEMMALLRMMFVSRKPLTALLCGHQCTRAARQANPVVNKIGKRALLMNPKKMNLKVMMQKSTNKLLFAQAHGNFVSFLFGLLSIPLGRVEWYLHSSTGVTAMDNLHWSIMDSLYGYDVMTTEAKDLLFKPPLFDDASCNVMDARFGCCNDYLALSFNRSKSRCHVRGSGMYMVSDNLRVTALSASSGVSVINEMKVALLDVEEVELQVGLEENWKMENYFDIINLKFPQCYKNSMPEAEQVKFHIKLVINREKTKVLFAEAGSDFADVLLSFLLLPLGTIVEVLEKQYGDKTPVVGSLNTLYKGASNLDVVHFHGEIFKKYVINSTHFESELCKLRLKIRGTQPTSSTSSESYEGVFTDGAASFIITDDLCVLPNGTGSIIETLSTLGVAVKDMDGMDIRNVTFGLNEIIALLKESLVSSNPLTALIFPGRKMIVATEGHVLLHHIDQRPSLVIPENMMLKVMLQKSTNKFLFAQADCDFVNFLFVMLIISLGRVEWFLGSSTGLKSLSVFNELKISLSDIKEVEVQVGLEELKTTVIATLPPPCSATILKQRMSKAEEVKLHIKVVINKEKKKVLFAEAGSDFTDVLLSFLLLPLGTTVEVLEKHYGDKAPVVGSLNTLYKGASNLDVVHFHGQYYKNCVIKSTHFESELCKLRLNIRGTQPTSSTSSESYEGVFTNGAASFIITDDLRVLPNVAGSIIETLSILGIAAEDMDDMETRNVTFGMNEIIGLLKESFVSSSLLTALIFPGTHGTQMIVATEEHVLLHQIDQKADVPNIENMKLKVMLQKSTNRLLFAQADYDFINSLFATLVISLGRVEWYMGSDTGLKNIDNLHKSVVDHFHDKHLKYSCTKDSLIKPKSSESTCFNKSEYGFMHLTYVRAWTMYMVSDDLAVAPLGLTSGLSVINELKISLSDIKEVELQVGLEEVLSILKAALTSTTALTDGLIKPYLMKQEREQQLVSKSCWKRSSKMCDGKEGELSLKVMINKEKTKVLFAEVDSHFADILLSFLTLPLGRIIKVLNNHYGDDETVSIGSLSSLYHSLLNLDSSHFWTEGAKQTLLNPKSCIEDDT